MGILDRRSNVHSQSGEDGIISYIFDKIGVERGNFIEFGAWDGRHLSNCLNLVNKGWSGIYIESDESRYRDLVGSFGGVEGITCVNKLVSFLEHDNLDTIIEECGHPNRDFDFVSIDVDGLDYWILEAYNRHLPKVICIEGNSGHHPLYDQIIPMEVAKNNVGQSLKVISDLGVKKGYFTLCYTGNIFLVKNQYLDLFKEEVRDLETMYTDLLSGLDREGLAYLKSTFVHQTTFHGHDFDNEILRNF